MRVHKEVKIQKNILEHENQAPLFKVYFCLNIKLTIIVCVGNAALTFLTKSTKCWEYPFATSKQINVIPGTPCRTSESLSKSLCAIPALAAMFGRQSGFSEANFFHSSTV